MLLIGLGHTGDRQVIHHGIIREDATDNTEVRLDVPLGTDSIRGLRGSKCSLSVSVCVILDFVLLFEQLSTDEMA